MVEEFERSSQNSAGRGLAIGGNSGTDALRFALIAAGVAKRCSGYSSEILHRDDGSDFRSGSAPGIRRYR